VEEGREKPLDGPVGDKGGVACVARKQRHSSLRRRFDDALDVGAVRGRDSVGPGEVEEVAPSSRGRDVDQVQGVVHHAHRGLANVAASCEKPQDRDRSESVQHVRRLRGSAAAVAAAQDARDGGGDGREGDAVTVRKLAGTQHMRGEAAAQSRFLSMPRGRRVPSSNLQSSSSR
jgi:hypothetical protein